ncbi:hypothetical protein ACKEN4_10555 [Acinetobacter baumannii]|uniref:hypothetical protein n=1 Tax=Acinetobacter baumannii TaxID=470 RepID=UPI0038B4FCFA
MRNQIVQTILKWLQVQEDGYLFNNQNFITKASHQDLLFNGRLLVSDNIFNAFQAPWQPLNASIEIPVKLGDEDFILTFNLFKISDTPNDFLVIAPNGTETDSKYLKHQFLKNELMKIENSTNDSSLIRSAVKDEDGSYLSRQDVLNKVEELKSWLNEQSLFN